MTSKFEVLSILRHGAVDWVTLNRPDRLNAINATMCDELATYFESLRHDRHCRVVVLRGAGRGFCAGLDISAFSSTDRSTRMTARLPDVILDMRRCPQPVIALLHGPVVGGGLALALAADIRIGGASVRFGDGFVKLGLTGCELGVSYFLPRLIGPSRAAEMMYTGRMIEAQQAESMGLVSRIVPDDELPGAADRLVAELLAIAPMALRRTKETLARALDMSDLSETMEMEWEAQVACMAEPDFAEAIAAFVEKRPPRFESVQ